MCLDHVYSVLQYAAVHLVARPFSQGWTMQQSNQDMAALLTERR